MTAITTTLPSTPEQRSIDPGFRATLSSEWAKARSLRSVRRNLVLGVVLGLGFTILLAVVTRATWGDWGPADRAEFDPVLFPLSGSIFTLIFFTAAAVKVMTSEYDSGMMRLTLTATPKRGRVLAAKALVVTLMVAVASTVATLGMFLIGQVIYAGGNLPTASLTDGDALRMFITMIPIGPMYPIVAVALAVLTRSTAAALTSTLALIFAPMIFGGLLPGWWQRNVLSLLPGPAGDSVTIGHLTTSEQYLHPVAATAVVLAWTVGALLLANLVLNRRDA